MSDYKVNGDTLDGADSQANLAFRDQTITPRYVAIHYTAGAALRSSIDHLKAKQLSYQILIDRDGTVVQGTPLSKRASHAGLSNWKGRESLNNWSIGISLANLGYIDRNGDRFVNLNSNGEATSAQFELGEVLVATHWNGHIGSDEKGWEPYTDAQYEALNEVIAALLDAFPDIVDAVGHDEIAVGRKADPGPAFDWERIHHLFARRQSDTGPAHMVAVRAGDNLNVRARPGADSPILARLAPGTRVHLRAHAYTSAGGTATRSNWVSIAREREMTHLGFVHDSFLRPA